MHIQRIQMNIASVNPYAAAAEKAVAAQRAADIRKKLAKSATALDPASTPDEAFTVGHWLSTQPDPIQIPAPSEAAEHASVSGKVSEFG